VNQETFFAILHIFRYLETFGSIWKHLEADRFANSIWTILTLLKKYESAKTVTLPNASKTVFQIAENVEKIAKNVSKCVLGTE
jgi:hypothetical protein